MGGSDGSKELWICSKINHLNGKYSVVPTTEIQHNHPPSCHPIAHVDTFERLWGRYFDRNFGSMDARNEEYDRVGEKTTPGQWKRFKRCRTDSKWPANALIEVLNDPFFRGRARYSHSDPGSVFFAHTHGYGYWKSYPEVVLVDDVHSFKCKVEGTRWRLLMFRGVDSDDRAFPVYACVTETDEEQTDMESCT